MLGLGEKLIQSPFPHLMIDDFLKPDFIEKIRQYAESLKEERFYIDPYGRQAHTVTDLEIVRFFFTEEFLAFMSASLNAPGLTYDEHYFPMIFRSPLHSPGLAPHNDFDEASDEVTGLIYLNSEWDHQSGGVLSLQSHGLGGLKDVVSYAPQYNRFVAFKIDEGSYHSVSEINASENRLVLSLLFKWRKV